MDVQPQQCWHLITEKTNILHICESLREHPKNITNFEKKKMLQKQNQKHMKMEEIAIFVGEEC